VLQVVAKANQSKGKGRILLLGPQCPLVLFTGVYSPISESM